MATNVYDVDAIRRVLQRSRVKIMTPGTDLVTFTYHSSLEDALSAYDPFFNIKQEQR
jgi:hypothetical protein